MELIDKLTFYRTKDLYIGRLQRIVDIKATTIWGPDPANDVTTVHLDRTPLNVFVAARLVQEPNYRRDDCYRDIITEEYYANKKAILSYHYFYYRKNYSQLFTPIISCADLHQKYISKEKIKKLIKNVEQEIMGGEKQHQD